ncbi:unnamed protein product [Owenia fusiformis]|uniref:Uncharacterized protein n=1 Tax=Owenia fusiformis TaxID=6347 RepID=A0A8J1TRU0_OWEFU|nr:unnamed protein product [Owenia fusiformis]
MLRNSYFNIRSTFSLNSFKIHMKTYYSIEGVFELESLNYLNCFYHFLNVFEEVNCEFKLTNARQLSTLGLIPSASKENPQFQSKALIMLTKITFIAYRPIGWYTIVYGSEDFQNVYNMYNVTASQLI